MGDDTQLELGRHEEQRELMKEATKEALKEWLDDKAASFGRWTLRWMLMAAFAGAVYLFLLSHGWKPPV